MEPSESRDEEGVENALLQGSSPSATGAPFRNAFQQYSFGDAEEAQRRSAFAHALEAENALGRLRSESAVEAPIGNALAGLNNEDPYRKTLHDMLGREIGRLENQLDSLRGTVSDFGKRSAQQDDEFKGLLAQMARARENVESMIADTERRLSEVEGQAAARFEAAAAAFTQQQAIKEPVKLWQSKQEEHDAKMRAAFRWFYAGLAVAGLLVSGVVLSVVFAPDRLSVALAPAGCNLQSAPQLCNGFGFRGLLISGGVLTLLTLLLWFIRLKMKEYLSERHLALDSRERRAFSQAYIGLLALGDSSEEARQQRAVVYASLFRPSTDGIVKEDGGLDPSITAAISKLLAGR